MDTAEVHSCIRETKTEFTSEKMKPESPVSNKSASDKSGNTAPDKSNGFVPDKANSLPEAQHVRDANSQTIFKNARLTCEFLRDYSGIPLFSDIQPEDIEDMTDRYQALLGIDFESDTVKKVHVHSKEEEIVYVISLIEHKSAVDYDVAMQLLRYMVMIWYEYAKQQNAIRRDASSQKKFRYPPIFPVVYYEGKARWTADLHLADRIQSTESLQEYIPDFSYRVVRLHDYSNKDLEEKQNGMGLVMMINKIQSPEDYTEFFKEHGEVINAIYENEPEDIKEVCRNVLWSLFMKMNLEVNKAQEMMNLLEENGMGVLFANAEKMDIQEERRLRLEAQKRAEKEHQMRIASESKAEKEHQMRIASESKAEKELQMRIASESKLQASESKLQASENKLQETERKLQELERLLRENSIEPKITEK